MGWYGTPGASKQDIIDEILSDLEERKQEHKVVVEDSETVLWIVVAGTTDQDEKYQYIVCYLIQYCGDCWGYKPMDETMGPCYYRVPVAWLDKYPCILPDEMHYGYSKEWRKKIKEAA